MNWEMHATHPHTETTKRILTGESWVFCLLFGPFYYAFKSMWGAAIISFFTFNGLWTIMPIMNKRIVTNHYENRGFKVRSIETEGRNFFETPQGLLAMIGIGLLVLIIIIVISIIDEMQYY